MRAVPSHSLRLCSPRPTGRTAGRAFAAGVVLVALGACGGSSSESPWPVEPLDKESGPRGESLPGAEASDLAPAKSPAEGAEGGGRGEEPSGELEPLGGGSAAGPR